MMIIYHLRLSPFPIQPTNSADLGFWFLDCFVLFCFKICFIPECHIWGTMGNAGTWGQKRASETPASYRHCELINVGTGNQAWDLGAKSRVSGRAPLFTFVLCVTPVLSFIMFVSCFSSGSESYSPGWPGNKTELPRLALTLQFSQAPKHSCILTPTLFPGSITFFLFGIK